MPKSRRNHAKTDPESRQITTRLVPYTSNLTKQIAAHTHQTNLDSSANLFVGRHAFNESSIQAFNESGFPQFPQAPIANKQPNYTNAQLQRLITLDFQT